MSREIAENEKALPELGAGMSEKEKENYDDLTQDEISSLRTDARFLGLREDVIDQIDRLALIRCLFYHVKNRDAWHSKTRRLRDKVKDYEKTIEFYGDKKNWFNSYVFASGEDDSDWVYKDKSHMVGTRGGKKAREVLNKHEEKDDCL